MFYNHVTFDDSSAGVGRTGTFICVDTLLHQIVDHDMIDIFGMVLNLRKFRTNIVQTEVIMKFFLSMIT